MLNIIKNRKSSLGVGVNKNLFLGLLFGLFAVSGGLHVGTAQAAAPTGFTSATYLDNNNNGTVDTLVVVINGGEALTTCELGGGEAASDWTYTGGDIGGTISPLGCASATATITFTINGANANVTGHTSAPTIAYDNDDGDASIRNASGILGTVSAVGVTDGAKPILLSAVYLDLTANGTVDTIRTIWSENVTMINATSADWTIVGGSITAVFSAATNDATAGTTLDITVTADAGETSGVVNPTITYNNDDNTLNSVIDAATVVNAANFTGPVGATDAAAPVIISVATGDESGVGLNKVTATFSENIVVNNGSGWTVTGADAGGRLAQPSNTILNKVVFTIDPAFASENPDATLTYTNEGGDYLVDVAGNELASTTSPNITGGIAPTVVSATTGDSNSNGKIDKLTVVYSAAVNDANYDAVAVTGYTMPGTGSGTGSATLVYNLIEHVCTSSSSSLIIDIVNTGSISGGGASECFTYSGAIYDQTDTNPTPIITGLSGGTFSSTPAGLSINPSTGTIDLATSALGEYEITYSTFPDIAIAFDTGATPALTWTEANAADLSGNNLSDAGAPANATDGALPDGVITVSHSVINIADDGETFDVIATFSEEMAVEGSPSIVFSEDLIGSGLFTFVSEAWTSGTVYAWHYTIDGAIGLENPLVSATVTDALDLVGNEMLSADTTLAVDTIAPGTPIASPVAAAYTATQSVTLSSTGSTSIRYTTTGIDPTCSTGTLYTGAISVSVTQTIEAVGCDDAGNISLLGSFAYTISSGSSGGSSGGSAPQSVPGFVPLTTTTVTTATTVSSGECRFGDSFSNVTGRLCPPTPPGCTMFTAYSGLTGQLCPAAMTLINPAFNPLQCSSIPLDVFLRRGSSGPEVIKLQMALKELGYFFGPITGFFGPITEIAVNSFQEFYRGEILTSQGLAAPTGYAKNFTLKKINELLCVNAQ